MGITLNLMVSTPLSEEEDQLLAGTAYWLMALANRNGQPAQPPGTDLPDDDEPRPCGAMEGTGEPAAFCVRDHGHSGRHKYRPLSFEGPLN
jgi:hypothetical protein